jgi:hypothetical protein
MSLKPDQAELVSGKYGVAFSITYTASVGRFGQVGPGEATRTAGGALSKTCNHSRRVIQGHAILRTEVSICVQRRALRG